MKKIALAFLLLSSFHAHAEEDPFTQGSNKVNRDMGLFGIGPAFYIIRYNEEVLSESHDASVTAEGGIDASGAQYAAELGLEVHYNLSFASGRCCLGVPIGAGNPREYSVSPFLGLYDFDDGVDGIILGTKFSYWRGDGKYKFKPALSLGIGYTVHMDQLVLANGADEGDLVPAGADIANYMERKDVGGWALTLSASVNY